MVYIFLFRTTAEDLEIDEVGEEACVTSRHLPLPDTSYGADSVPPFFHLQRAPSLLSSLAVLHRRHPEWAELPELAPPPFGKTVCFVRVLAKPFSQESLLPLSHLIDLYNFIFVIK